MIQLEHCQFEDLLRDSFGLTAFFLVKLLDGVLFGVSFLKLVFLIFVNSVVFLVGGGLLSNGSLN